MAPPDAASAACGLAVAAAAVTEASSRARSSGLPKSSSSSRGAGGVAKFARQGRMRRASPVRHEQGSCGVAPPRVLARGSVAVEWPKPTVIVIGGARRPGTPGGYSERGSFVS